MRAAYVRRLGPPDSICCGELPEPQPGPGELLVDVVATAVNPVDALVRSGRYRTPVPFPFVIGRDLVGTVTAAGAGVTGFAVGDRVWSNSLGHGGRQGAAAERAVVPADRLYPLPAGADPVTTVATVHPAATAHLALFRHGRLTAGDTVVVAGAAGNVGRALIVLAVTAGARVVATAHPRDAEHCRRLGAAEVLDYRDRALTAHLRDLCPVGVDVHLDTSGENDLASAVDLLAPRGRIVLLAGVRSRPTLPVGPLYTKDGAVVGFAISLATVDELAGAASTINRMVSVPGSPLHPRTVESLSLGDAAEVHRRLERGELHGRRVVLRTHDGGDLRQHGGHTPRAADRSRTVGSAQRGLPARSSTSAPAAPV